MAKMLWSPTEARSKNTQMYRFMSLINQKHKKNFTEYEPLYRWSV